MSEENKNEEALPIISLDDFNRSEEAQPRGLGDGIEVVEGGLENYQQGEEEPEEENFDLTNEEIKKNLRAIRKKEDGEFWEDVTEDDVENLTDENKEKIKEYLQLKERKAIYKFVYNKKNVSDDDVKDMTNEEFVDLTAKAFAKSQHFSYNPKKDFGTAYKKKRQNRNKMAKASRRANR